MTPTMLALIMAPQGGGQGLVPMLIMWGGIIAIFWFLLIRPQRKAQQEHEEMVEKLRRGDEVMTDGGIMGEVTRLNQDRVTIRTADDTRLVVARPKIARLLNEPAEERE